MLSDNVKKGVLSYLKNKVGKYQCCFVDVGLGSICDNYFFVFLVLYYSAQPEETKSILPLYHICGKQNRLVPYNHKPEGEAATLFQLRQTADWQERRGALGDTRLLPPWEPAQARRARGEACRPKCPGQGCCRWAQVTRAPLPLDHLHIKGSHTLSFPLVSLLRFLHKNFEMFQQECTPWFLWLRFHRRYGPPQICFM